jgi:hypothetical protein
MMSYHALAPASTGAMLAFAAVIVMLLVAGVTIAYALETHYKETGREALRLGHRALGELETAHAEISRLAAKFDTSETAPLPYGAADTAHTCYQRGRITPVESVIVH